MKNINKLQFDIASATCKAAISCYPWIGKGDEVNADRAAVESLRMHLNAIDMNGVIVMGEGERDAAPMLYVGENIGGGEGLSVDIAVDPLEGTTLCAHNKHNAMSVLAIAEYGKMLKAPDVYMNKIAVGANLPKGVVDLDNSLEQNLYSLAEAKAISISQLHICVLQRERHKELINKLRTFGVKITLIDDGDVLACIKTCLFDAEIDMYIGIGGAPEGVLAAAALKCFGGQMQGRLLFNTQEEIDKANILGIKNISKKYSHDDMIMGDVLFAATWVTDGVLQGVKKTKYGYITETLLASSYDHAIKIIKSECRNDNRR